MSFIGFYVNTSKKENGKTISNRKYYSVLFLFIAYYVEPYIYIVGIWGVFVNRIVVEKLLSNSDFAISHLISDKYTLQIRE